MKLSILICSVHTRRNNFLPKIMDEIFSQYERLSDEQKNEVEILILMDNKKIMLGTKRNYMVDMAQGEYIVFIDDDDRIHPDYINHLLQATESGSDVIVFQALVSIPGQPQKPCYYSISFEADLNHPGHYERLPNHICCIRREHAEKVEFPAVPYGEDSGFSKQVKKYLRSETNIHQILYFYDYNPATTETQQHLNKRKPRIR